MSGGLKHFFDQIYYPCMNETTSLPYGYFLHGNNDAAGAWRPSTQLLVRSNGGAWEHHCR